MKRKLAVILLGAALTITGCGMTAGASETGTETAAEEVITEAESETAAAEETESASDTEDASETETESTLPAEEPDYKALDYVTLGDYKGLEVTLTKIEVTDEEVDAQIKQNISDSGEMDSITEGTVESGDTAVIDYVGKKDGEAFDGGSAKNYELVIGSNTFIDGFEDGVIGMAVGETKDLDLTFPENYGNSDLAGQAVVFTVTVNEIKRTPELSDELVAKISDFDTVEEYREDVKNSLLEGKKTSQPSQKLNDLYSQIYANSTINGYPEDVVAYRAAQFKSYYTDAAKQYEMTFDDFLSQYLQMTEEEFDSQTTSIVENSMTQEMLMKAIAENENLEVDDTYYKENIQRYVDQTGMDDEEALLAAYGETELKNTMLMDRAMEFVVDNCVVTNPEDEVQTEATEAAEETASEENTEAVSETAESASETETETETA